jgi:hypothetical protein
MITSINPQNLKGGGAKMKKHVKQIITVLAIMVMICFSSSVYAAKYNVTKITHIYTNTEGAVLIKWAGSPRPGPCVGPGETNYGWVAIPPTASDALKALAISLYLKGKRARIDTSGCYKRYEKVKSIYSPGG